MKKSRFTEAQILAVLKQGEGGIPVADHCREYSNSAANYDSWRTYSSGLRCLPRGSCLDQ